MTTKAYDNPIRRQVFDLPKLVGVQVENCFRYELKDLMSISEIFDIRKIIITGCGDSYAAAIAMAPVLEKYSETFGVTPMRAIDFTRFLTKEEIGIGEPNSPLVIGISAGGGTARVVEALEKAKEVGAFPIVITNNPGSRCAAAAKRVLNLETPPFPDFGPGLRSYFASMIGIVALAMRFGHVKGVPPPTASRDFQDAITGYADRFFSGLDAMDEQMFHIAEKWKDFTQFDFIGDGVEYGSAFFGAAKFYESSGTMAGSDDSEDWCHINFFLKNAEKIGTVLMADKNSPAYSREIETARSAVAIGRPLLVVTNGRRHDFPKNADVCMIPETPEGFEWLLPLFDYIPSSLVAGYVAVLQGEPFFRRTPEGQKPTEADADFGDQSCMTVGNSKIEIHD